VVQQAPPQLNDRLEVSWSGALRLLFQEIHQNGVIVHIQ
jgi:hypothetical protein